MNDLVLAEGETGKEKDRDDNCLKLLHWTLIKEFFLFWKPISGLSLIY